MKNEKMKMAFTIFFFSAFIVFFILTLSFDTQPVLENPSFVKMQSDITEFKKYYSFEECLNFCEQVSFLYRGKTLAYTKERCIEVCR